MKKKKVKRILSKPVWDYWYGVTWVDRKGVK